MQLIFACLVLIMAIISPQLRKISSAQSLVEAMQSRYAGKWSRTITFVQHNVHY